MSENLSITEWYEKYKEEVLMCDSCACRKECTRPVPGAGNLNPDIVVIGRNPGATEDEVGKPFVGMSGQVLDDFLKAAEVEREDVFITNLTLCKTLNNRQQTSEELKICMKKFFTQTFEHIHPRMIVVFGAAANKWVNGIVEMKGNNGRIFVHKSLKCLSVCSIHPAYICYRGDRWLNGGGIGALQIVADTIKKYKEVTYANILSK